MTAKAKVVGDRPTKRRKTGGRKKGVANKTTRDVRAAIALLLETNAENLGRWLTLVAEGDGANVKPDPGNALDLITKLSEYHIPKLARTEVSGTPGGERRLVSAHDGHPLQLRRVPTLRRFSESNTHIRGPWGVRSGKFGCVIETTRRRCRARIVCVNTCQAARRHDDEDVV
jgi:hypothetical protein